MPPHSATDDLRKTAELVSVTRTYVAASTTPSSSQGDQSVTGHPPVGDFYGAGIRRSSDLSRRRALYARASTLQQAEIGMPPRSHPASSYAVLWRTPGDHTVVRGGLQLEDSSLLLHGTDREGAIARERIALEEIASVRIGRSEAERVLDQRSILLQLRSGGIIAIAPLGMGELFELAELVAELSAAKATERDSVAVVLPLRRGTAERARELVSAGPPFDLTHAGLERHQVFVTDHEVVFVFDGDHAYDTLARLVRNPRVLRTAAAWRECLAGSPRLAAQSYAWQR